MAQSDPNPSLDSHETLAVRTGFLDALAVLPAPLAHVGRAVLDRISSPNWLLEWELPRWLGESFSLDTAVTRALVTANLFGLAAFRLLDDLLDGDVMLQDREAATLLATILHQRWVLQHIDLFEAASPFWAYFHSYVAQWLHGTMPGDSEPVLFRDDGEAGDLLWLADRGAPLKTCCAAACLLAGRETQLTLLEETIDLFLVAAVLHDHVQDWADDLAAARLNAFVACYASHPQTAEHQQANRQDVLEELLLGDGANRYFHCAELHIEAAIRGAQELGCTGLERHVRWFAARSKAFRQDLVTAHRNWLREKTIQAFGPQS